MPEPFGRQDPEPVRRTRIAEVAEKLMNRFNQWEDDPSEMAMLGHDTSRGYEFAVEKDGRTFKVTVELEE